GEDGEPEEPSEDTGAPSEETEAPDREEASLDETEDSEDSVSENTISENTLPEEDPEEEDVFAIFPGLGDNYTLSSTQMADKRVLAAHVSDILSTYARNADEYPDADGIYELGEVVYLAETAEEAEQVATAFGGEIDSYSYGVAVISLPKKATVTMAVAAAAEPDMKLPAVWPNYYNYLTSDVNEGKAVAGPTDPGLGEQWQHDYIGTSYAWAAGYKGQGVKVAVIDSGLQKNHEDLSANAVAGRNFVKGATGTENNTDNGTHGTHVAGIIAADDNGKGGVGIAPDAQVRGYCVFPSAGESADSADIMRAINAAVTDGNDIINMSLGSSMYNAQYEETVSKAYKAGVAIFASSGNDDTDGYNFPAAYNGAISVGAVDQNGARASFSNYGGSVKLSFPGVHIYSTLPSGYGYMSGTSQACPAASGTAAVILSANDSIRKKTGKARVDALLSAMKSSTTKCSSSGMGAGTTWLPGALKIASDMSAPDAPVITIKETPKTGTTYETESVTVTLSTKTAVGVEIWYTTDGKNPTYKNGEVTNGSKYTEGATITLTGAKKVTIKAIALNPITGKASKVASKACTLAPIPTAVTLDSKTGISRVAPGKSLALSAFVTPAYAVSAKVQWSVGDTEKDAGITVANGTIKTKATTAPGKYTVKATAVGADGKNYNGAVGTYEFEVIGGSIIQTIAFKDNGKNLKAQTLDTGKTLDLKLYLNVTTQEGSVYGANDVIWSSSNSKVATVKDGVVTAVAPGKAVIKAISNDGYNKSASCNITVKQPVTGIALSGPQKVAVGKAITLKATVAPANATNQKLTWKVEGNDKVTVANGKVTAKSGATGTCTVTATAADGSNISSAAYPITIVSGKITTITLSDKSKVLFSKKASADTPLTGKLTATVDGEPGADTTLIEWTSSAPSIVSVDTNGNITAKAPGKATITCAATDGSNKKATCTVKVNVPMSKLSIGTTDSYGSYFNDLDGYGGYIAQGKSIKLSAKYSSNYGTPTDKKVTWASSDPSILKVDKNGKVTAVKEAGLYKEAYITATAADGSGVVSNRYLFVVTPLFKAISIGERNHIVTVTLSDGSEIYAPEYFTVTVSGGKNPGLDKGPETVIDETTGEPFYIYYVDPIPGKVTTNKPSSTSTLYMNEAQKMTVTVKLRDGSGLTAKMTTYAARFADGTIKYTN
ncbi:MAG: S8 family serine peptidase, partial [Lachnospiraceae bacterium]|nr:S8 family serine peptidase [Lachnospiraceae bacterium]